MDNYTNYTTEDYGREEQVGDFTLEFETIKLCASLAVALLGIAVILLVAYCVYKKYQLPTLEIARQSFEMNRRKEEREITPTPAAYMTYLYRPPAVQRGRIPSQLFKTEHQIWID